MKNVCTTIICFIAILVLSGCSSTLEKRSQKLQLGMTKDNCVQILGNNYSVVASRLEASGSPIAVIKFYHKKQPDIFLYFRNDKLVQWGDVEVLKAMPPPVVQQ